MERVKISSIMPFLIGIAVVAVAFINCTSAAKNSAGKTTSIEGKGFAVVELFTSEGCSSCPPADELVAKVEKEVDDKPVYILAYHVDYWDRLGWKDSFSDAAYTKRQNQYAGWLNLSQIYTPQIVVNGKTEFVGSQEGALRNAIKNGLQGSNVVKLKISAQRATSGAATIQYSVEGSTNNSGKAVLLALVQKQAVSKVKAGENGGRTLAHSQIVREIQNVPLKNYGSTNIALPAGFDANGYEVIGFIQDNDNGGILAAAKSGFNVTATTENTIGTKSTK
ncbi:DUF1223 domain-containing protein [Mucilaginibacter celer]|uniref:DUF1223 domain-containing protein n=1 Tax=Mucilaginibacter celer TaxID=2305508 RepID=A0A494VVH3_9SPHI|nr:DUF1223 domain-containing protein [Mucilaginibacter celer]AYL98071.1 DUF1223 domain-containing protein [Mucilaginibacter celer]